VRKGHRPSGGTKRVILVPPKRRRSSAVCGCRGFGGREGWTRRDSLPRRLPCSHLGKNPVRTHIEVRASSVNRRDIRPIRLPFRFGQTVPVQTCAGGDVRPGRKVQIRGALLSKGAQCDCAASQCDCAGTADRPLAQSSQPDEGFPFPPRGRQQASEGIESGLKADSGPCPKWRRHSPIATLRAGRKLERSGLSIGGRGG